MLRVLGAEFVWLSLAKNDGPIAYPEFELQYAPAGQSFARCTDEAGLSRLRGSGRYRRSRDSGQP
jgi:hypothetical protein